MDQYYLLRRKFFSSLQNALLYTQPTQLFIRFRGSLGGATITKINLTGKQFSIKRGKKQLIFFVDGKQCYIYKSKWTDSPNYKIWAVEYYRITDDNRMFIATTGFPNPWDGDYTGPDDPRLPEPYQTFLRSANGEHFVEITFPGRIPIIKSNERTKNATYLHEWNILKKEETMEHDTSFFDSIYNGKLFSITHAANLNKEAKKKKLEELKKEIEEIPAYKTNTDKSFVSTANNILKKINEALSQN